MRKIILFFTLLVFSNVWSQKIETEKDSLKTKSIEIFRQIFWNNLPKPVAWTNDYEDLFTDEQQQEFNNIIDKFEQETTIEIGIVTIDTIKVSEQKFEDLSLHIANIWGIGKSKKDNGILIAISNGHKQLRIQNGYGIEKILSDQETKVIIDDYFVPEFKKGNYYLGTLNGLTELIRLLKTKNYR